MLIVLSEIFLTFVRLLGLMGMPRYGCGYAQASY